MKFNLKLFIEILIGTIVAVAFIVAVDTALSGSYAPVTIFSDLLIAAAGLFVYGIVSWREFKNKGKK